MYLQITTKCNMLCAHCCYRCTMNGQHMSRKTYKKAISFVAFHSEYVSIGGGEPTLHPNFWEILGMCLGSFEHVWLATNGSKTDIAIKLANMAKKGFLSATLSQDNWHSEIDEAVIEAFEQKSYEKDDSREIRNVFKNYNEETLSLSRSGDFGMKENCPCEGNFVLPNGDIKQCGCLDSPIIGNVFDGFFPIKEKIAEEEGQDSCWQKVECLVKSAVNA